MNSVLKKLSFIGILMIAFLVFFTFTSVFTAYPFIREALNLTLTELQWLENIFLVVLVSSMVPAGRIADAYGRKKILYLGICIYAVSTFFAGLSDSVISLLISRGFQGLGVAVLFVVSASLISDLFPKSVRTKAAGVYSAVIGIGLTLGPFVAGILIEKLNWRWVFWFNLPFLIIGLICCIRGFCKIKESHHQLIVNWKGLIIFISALICVLYGVVSSEQQRNTWFNEWIIFAIGVVLFGIFFIQEKVRRIPTLDWSIFQQPSFILVLLTCSLAGIISCVLMFFNALYLHQLQKFTPIEIGFIISIIPMSQVTISLIFHNIIKIIKFHRVLFGSIILACAGIIMQRAFNNQTETTYVIVTFILLGFTWGIGNSGAIYASNRYISQRKAGTVLGTIYTIWNLIGAVFLAVSTSIFNKFKMDSFYATYSQIVNFISICALIILSLALVIFYKNRLTD